MPSPNRRAAAPTPDITADPTAYGLSWVAPRQRSPRRRPMRELSHQSSRDGDDRGTVGNGRMSPGRATTRRLVVLVPQQAEAARTPRASVRLCDLCGRPMAALDKDEYTVARAELVVDKGLCVCS